MTADPARYYTTPDACSCPDWRWRRRAGGCKHMRALVAALELIAANDRKWLRSDGSLDGADRQHAREGDGKSDVLDKGVVGVAGQLEPDAVR